MEQQDDDIAADKRRLIGRIGFALVVLVGLLASLSVFDRLNEPPLPAPTPARPAPPVSVASGPPPLPPAKAEAPGVAAVEAEKPAVVEETALPKDPKATPLAGKALTPPATGRHAVMRPTEVAVSPAPTPAAPGQAGSAPRRDAATPEIVRPAAQAASRPYALQVGVFGEVANAEELRARLEKAGIRASIEARVHVGPFASRAEAEAARVKLRELGIAESVLFSMKGARGP